MTTIKVSLGTFKQKQKLSSHALELVGGWATENPQEILPENFRTFVEQVGSQGYGFCPATFKERTFSKNNFEQTQLISLYFNTAARRMKTKAYYQDVLERAKKYQIPVWFIYDVFSNELFNPDDQSFCVVFLLSSPVYDPKEANSILQALLMIFPEADPSNSIFRLSQGGNQILYYNRKHPELDIDWIFMKMCLYLKERYGSKHYKRNLYEYCKQTCVVLNKQGYPDISLYLPEEYHTSDITDCKNGGNLPTPTIDIADLGRIPPKIHYHINFEDNQTSSTDKNTQIHSVKKKSRYYRSKDLKLLTSNCQLYKDFITYDRVLTSKELLGLSSNMIHIESGREQFMSVLRSKSYRREKQEQWQFQLNYIKIQPERPCCTFCPYHTTCQHGGSILAALKPKSHQIIRLENYNQELVSLEEAHTDFLEQLSKAIESNKKGWHIIVAQTSIGKTAAILQYIRDSGLRILIAVPTNKLKREIIERAKELGIDLVASPSLHELKDLLPDDVWSDIEAAYLVGKSPMERINRAILENDKRCADILKKYKSELSRFHSCDCGVTTHRRLSKMDVSKYDLVIVDEDIIYSTIIPNRGQVTISDLKKLRKELNSYDPLYRKTNKILHQCPQNEYFTLDTVSYNKSYCNLKTKVNIPSLCSAKYFCYRSASNKENELEKDSVSYVEPVCFPNNTKYIMLSATANKAVCEYCFGEENVSFYTCKEAYITGRLNFYGDRNMSRRAMRQDMDIIPKIKKCTGFKHTISFKEFEQFYEGELHYGNCAGCDFLKNQNIDVIGTPHQPEWIYKLFAYSMGLSIDYQLIPQTPIIRNGFKFTFTTYRDLVLKNIQLYMIESELEQAVGRARLLRCDCTVNLFSDYPLKQSILQPSEYDV